MRPLDGFPMEARRLVKGVLTDIDDTRTTGGRLTAEAYAARRRASKSFDDAPHRLQLSSYPTSRLRDLYEP